MPPPPTREIQVPLATRLGSGEGLARTEWLLASGLGGFAMGTASGIPSRRYHGWLIGSARPPVARVLALAAMAEWLILLPGAAGGTSEQRYDLSSFRFSGTTGGSVSPKGVESLQRFEKGPTSVRHEYKFGLLKASREILPLHGQNAVMIRYRLRTGGHAGTLELHPLVALRDFHGPLIDHHAREDAYTVSPLPSGVEVTHRAWHVSICSAGISSGASFVPGPRWWYNFEYMREAERGLDAHEDLFCPGVLSVPLPSYPAVSGDDLEHVIDVTASFWADDGLGQGSKSTPTGRASHAADAVRTRMADIVSRAVTTAEHAASTLTPSDRSVIASLAAAGDAFIVERVDAPSTASDVSVIAGYPWFSDWGRDTMISLRGLFLETGRHDEAGRVLETFARYTDHGLIPNCFDDVTGEPQYHTVDASLWFIHAACDYLATTSDAERFFASLLPACNAIIAAYRDGISHHGEDGDWSIKMDADGLIEAGHPGTALTWMDARRDGVVFTPRDGKPVEIQALWYHALLALAGAIDAKDPRLAREYRQLAERTGTALTTRYWDPARGYLADRLTRENGGGGGEGWTSDWSNRCNQIFAASLAHSPLTPAMRAGVVSTVRSRLLTPMGLRTLDPRDPRYIGRYRGPLFERDKAYHNGTVWPWLIGPYIRALLRSGADSGNIHAACTEARQALTPLMNSITAGLAAGSLPEIFDGDLPMSAGGGGGTGAPGFQKPDGCMAQAWSVAQTLEALLAILRAER
jgi:glycogen debranching enzyme